MWAFPKGTPQFGTCYYNMGSVGFVPSLAYACFHAIPCGSVIKKHLSRLIVSTVARRTPHSELKKYNCRESVSPSKYTWVRNRAPLPFLPGALPARAHVAWMQASAKSVPQCAFDSIDELTKSKWIATWNMETMKTAVACTSALRLANWIQQQQNTSLAGKCHMIRANQCVALRAC